MNALEVRNLSKTYKGFQLRNVSFDLPRGYIMGLIGPNGAGKTTLIKSILNVVRRNQGTIRILGTDSDASEAQAKRAIGVVLDEPPFYQDVSLRDLKRSFSLFYADWDEDLFQSHCRDLELPLGKKFKHLSRGMQSKFALALALSHHAELLILDEPTSGLDPVFRRRLLHALQEFIRNGERSVLFSTHITSDLEHVADYVTFLKAGEVVFSTTREDLEKNWALIRGGPELLESAECLFEGTRRGAFSVEALTRDVERARRELPGQVLFEKASLEEIMVLHGRRSEHA